MAKPNTNKKPKPPSSYGRDKTTGQFLPQNKWWEARSTHGRNPIFESSSDLLDACLQYFEWVEDHPLKEEKVFHANGIITRTTVSKMRPATKGGLCLFLDIAMNTWDTYKENSDFIRVTEYIESAIREQKFAGATADLMNPNIIARDLGLVDKRENDNTGTIIIEVMRFSDEKKDQNTK